MVTGGELNTSRNAWPILLPLVSSKITFNEQSRAQAARRLSTS